MEFIPQVIDGEETESVSGERFASVDPWTREPWPRSRWAVRRRC
jgi:aminomuconate-semialdehyde/2-hydroxymuconate-6-semialdehyde dehydrogenase